MAADTIVVDRYGVMGYPVSHSRSPVIHRLFAHQTGEKIQYELLQVAPDNLERAVRQFEATGGKGLNITVPHKTAVCDLVDEMSERASAAGAVNTLSFRDGEIFGDNTDGVGLIRDVVVNRGVNLEKANILILGAGGATRGVVGPLLEKQPRLVLIANRTPKKAEIISDHFARSGPTAFSGFDDIPNERWHLIINATSAGTKGETPPYPTGAIGDNTLCYDMAYGLRITPFCQWARDQGATNLAMGWGMLVEQAAESFAIWRGIRPDTAPVLKQIAVSA